MLPLVIDISGVLEEFTLSNVESASLSKYILARVGDEYMRKWQELINDNLHSTRREYERAIFTEQPDDYNIIIGMTPRQSPLALMLEEGADPFDQKAAFKGSDKAKNKGTDNWYLTVPFRLATSEAVAESSVFTGKMPVSIEGVVKKQDSSLKFAQIPTELAGLRSRGAINRRGKTYPEYQHKNNIFEGLKRSEIGSTSKEKRGGYVSFRRVSENSDPDSWIHKGFQALKLMDKAMRDIQIDRVVDMATDEFLSKRG